MKKLANDRVVVHYSSLLERQVARMACNKPQLKALATGVTGALDVEKLGKIRFAWLRHCEDECVEFRVTFCFPCIVRCDEASEATLSEPPQTANCDHDISEVAFESLACSVARFDGRLVSLGHINSDIHFEILRFHFFSADL